MFVLGVPMMFYYLVKATSDAVLEKFPVKPVRDSDLVNVPPALVASVTETILWNRKVAQSQNVAKFLFQPFLHKYRFVRLFQIIQKLLIVGTTTYIVRGTRASPSMISLGCALVVHTMTFFLVSYHQPFLSKFEGRISIAMMFCLTLSCVVALLLLQGYDVPTGAMYAMIIMNGLLPLTALVVGIALEWWSSKSESDEKEKDEMMRLAEATALEEQRERDEEQKKRDEAEAAEKQRQDEGKAKELAAQLAIENEQHKKTEEEEAAAATANMAKQPEATGETTLPPGEVPPIDGEAKVEIGLTQEEGEHELFSTTLDAEETADAREKFDASYSNSALMSTGHTSTAGAAEKKTSFSLFPASREEFDTPAQRRARMLKKQQQRALLHKRVKSDMHGELLKLNEQQGDVDLYIDRLVKSILQVFLMVGGVLAVIALGCCILGLLARQQTNFTGPFPSNSSTATELASYTSWNEFTSHCCCLEYHNNENQSSFTTLEKWVCENGKVKERIRETYSANLGFTSGNTVRPYCSITFAGDCAIVVDNSTLAVTLVCTSATRTPDELDLW
jgi:hypothetical protein